jgi:hypothetical protein
MFTHVLDLGIYIPFLCTLEAHKKMKALLPPNPANWGTLIDGSCEQRITHGMILKNLCSLDDLTLIAEASMTEDLFPSLICSEHTIVLDWRHSYHWRHSFKTLKDLLMMIMFRIAGWCVAVLRFTQGKSSHDPALNPWFQHSLKCVFMFRVNLVNSIMC